MNYKQQRYITDKIKAKKVFAIEVSSFRNWDDLGQFHFTDYSGSEDFVVEINDEQALEFTITATGAEEFVVEDLKMYDDGEYVVFDKKIQETFERAILKLTEPSNYTY